MIHYSSRRTGIAVTILLSLGLALPSITANAGSTTVAHAALTEEHNRQIINDAFDRWAAGGSQFFNDVLVDDVVWIIEGSGPSAGTFNSRADFMERAVLPFVRRLAGPVRPTDWRVWADGDHVIVNWEGSGTALDGAPYENSYAWIFHMKDGKAIKVTAFLDLAPYDDVLRRIPEPSE